MIYLKYIINFILPKIKILIIKNFFKKNLNIYKYNPLSNILYFRLKYNSLKFLAIILYSKLKYNR